MELGDIELDLLLEAVFRRYGFDFRQYARASLKRRVEAAQQEEQLATISQLQDRVLHDEQCMQRLVRKLSVTVTSMFRDPTFYLALRQRVVPLLKTYPFVRVWNAGCSTGEEVYSLAILLQEEGLYERARIYATDVDESVVTKAQEGIFPLSSMQKYTTNYIKAGGTKSFSEYYTAHYDNTILSPSLKENIVFSQHNLATDGCFNQFHLIVCRNVMIYFNKSLQQRVLDLFCDSLEKLAVLALGRKESLALMPQDEQFNPLDSTERIYRRLG